MNHSDLALTFVDSCCYAVEGLQMPVKELWDAYKEWSAESNLRLLQRKDLLSRLEVYFPFLPGHPLRISGLHLRDVDDWEWFNPSDLRKVYLISDGRRTKIGISVDPPTRLEMLQVGSAEPLTLLHCWLGSYEQEVELQRRYAHKHVRGEWFDLDAQEIATIVRLAQCIDYTSR